jgi:hypothetical protein
MLLAVVHWRALSSVLSFLADAFVRSGIQESTAVSGLRFDF